MQSISCVLRLFFFFAVDLRKHLGHVGIQINGVGDILHIKTRIWRSGRCTFVEYIYRLDILGSYISDARKDFR